MDSMVTVKVHYLNMHGKWQSFVGDLAFVNFYCEMDFVVEYPV